MQITFNQMMVAKPNYTPYKSGSFVSLKPIATDVVSFSGNEQQDFLSLDDKTILRRVKKSIKKANSIGRGGEAEVYKIPDTGYCVRVPHDSFDKLGKVVDRTVLPHEKVNHTVAKLANDVTIMPLLKGYTFCSDNISNTQVAKMIEEMPQAAIDQLLKQVFEAYDYDMAFDAGWKNIIVNPENKTLTAIDFLFADEVVFNDKILSRVYLSLTNNLDTTTKQRKICAGKFLTTLADSLAPNKLPIKDIYALGMGSFVNVLKSHKLFDNNLYAKLFQGILVKIEDLKQQESFGTNVVDDLNGQLKVLKSLIKQLF